MPEISIEEKVRGFIEERFLASAGLERVQEEESFIENGIIDSTGVLELVHFLEETFVIKIEDDELVPDNLDSIRNIVAFLGRKTSMNTLRE
jgi:acyl carrier protein